MWEVSIYSVIMAVLWSSALILIMKAVSKVNDLVVRYGCLPVAALYLGCLIRIVFPYDIYGYTEPIVSKTIIAAFNTVLYYPLMPVAASDVVITPIWVILAVWIIGFVRYLVRDLRAYRKVTSCIHVFDECEDGPIYEEAQRLAKELHIKRFLILMDPSVKIPCVFGFRCPVVCISNIIEYTAAEYHYALKHEFSHWKNGDMYVRALSLLFNDIFWWNPCSKLLLKGINHTLEIRCDASVVGSEPHKIRWDYVDVIFSVTGKACTDKPKDKRIGLVSQVSGEEFDRARFQQRVDIAAEYRTNKKRSRRAAVFMTAAMIVLLAFSYRFIFQPGYDAPMSDYEVDAGYSLIDKSESYLIKISDNLYELYLDGEFSDNIDADSAKMLLDDGFELKEK